MSVGLHNQGKDEYGWIAPLYDTLIGPFVASIRKDVCGVAVSVGCRSVVDICCGTGQQAIMLSQLGISVSGVDISPAMLSIAREKSPPSITYYQEDASDLHFPDGAFDCASISFALHEKDERTRSRIIREMKRVVKQDGRMIVVDYLSPHGVSTGFAYPFIKVIERMAGAQHYKNFKQYMENGAMESLLQSHQLRAGTSKRYGLGTIGLVLVSSSRRQSSSNSDFIGQH